MPENDFNPGLKAIKTHILPPQIRVLVGIIGLPETLKLLQARGGTLTYIPKTGDKSVVFTQLLQARSLEKLMHSDLAGQEVHLPKADKLLKQIRDMEIISQRGIKSRAELAREYNLTIRRIQGIWSGAQDTTKHQPVPQTPQQDLF